jgi:hypothetical protein
MRTISMKLQFACFAALSLFSVALATQAPAMITMDQEPHHHLVLRNDYVKVFAVKVSPGDSILLHRHDHDAIAIAIGDQQVTVGIPGKPDVHLKNPDGQIRLQAIGYTHSTQVDPGSAYQTIAVELLHPQGNPRNLCAPAIAGQPLNCPDPPAKDSSAKSKPQPQFQTDQTRVQAVRVSPHQAMEVGHLPTFELIVALDRASISPLSGKGPAQALAPGDFVWLDKDGPSRTLKNEGNSDARFIEISIRPTPASQLLSTPAGRTLPGYVVKTGTRQVPAPFAQERFE